MLASCRMTSRTTNSGALQPLWPCNAAPPAPGRRGDRQQAHLQRLLGHGVVPPAQPHLGTTEPQGQGGPMDQEIQGPVRGRRPAPPATAAARGSFNRKNAARPAARAQITAAGQGGGCGWRADATAPAGGPPGARPGGGLIRSTPASTRSAPRATSTTLGAKDMEQSTVGPWAGRPSPPGRPRSVRRTSIPSRPGSTERLGRDRGA